MRRVVLTLLVLLFIGLTGLFAYGWFGLRLRSFLATERVELGPGMFAILGGGGNSVVLFEKGKGALIVDTKMWPAATGLLEAVRAAGASPEVVINTHHHVDHTHGNPAYPRETKVFAADKARDNLLSFDRAFWEEEPAKSLLPRLLVADGEAKEIEFGSERVSLVRLPPAHTDGDVAVLFRNARVVHGGDVFVNGMYPRIDRKSRGESAGSWRGVMEALDRILALPADTFVPGHGKIGDRAAVEKSRAFVASLVEQTGRIAAGGGTVDDALARVDLSSFAFRNLGPFTSREKCIRTAWDELAPEK